MEAWPTGHASPHWGAEHGTPILEVRNISKRFGATQALSGVSLSFLPGTVHAVVGENGAGKSTLMNLVGGVHQAGRG